ncbi:cytochrome P450 (plasmid) [Halostagnicola larsenii XH-48]|uniref:Cytochrome P450 n=1 Tax=Halostagnicola larsenii XH-48 TaxID=797299 RepID=W0JYZ9_9EURY|nr:cytochrome P450 [Halostagnicola larsenii]AHG02425.1 cytochrome P450 [Halostagnicola larsenii XH-48]
MPNETRSGETPPGPRGLPVVGADPAMIRGGLDFRSRVAAEYGDVVHWDGVRGDVYQLNHPDDIEHVLVQNNQNYVKGENFQKILGPLTGNGILNSEGEEWRRNRHLVQPAFHPDRIEVYAEMMTDFTEEMCQRWSDGQRLLIHEDMMELTLQIVAKALFGADVEDHLEEISTAIDTFLPATSSLPNILLPEEVPLPSRRKMDNARETLDTIVEEIIRERRADPGDDVVSALLSAADEEGNALTDEQIHDEIITLLTAGHETTAVSLTYTTYLLSQHPKVERRLVEELEGRTPEMSDLAQLTYTEQVVKESMRLFPPVPAIVREAVSLDTVGGYEIPAGATVHMSQWVVHRDPRWYDDARTFRPERWTSEMESELPRLAYFPFAAGPRRCIGDRFAMLEARLLLATIYQHYHLELVSDRTLEVIPTVTSRPKEDVVMVAHER